MRGRDGPQHMTCTPTLDRDVGSYDVTLDRPTHGGGSLAIVLVAGILARLALIPITRGQDFQVWDLATRATLHGQDVFRHHPNYPGGPYAYLPMFLDIELPFQWLAQHGVASFTVLGKLPILAGDVACALLIKKIAEGLGAGDRASVGAAAVFFCNPLVIYNSAYYGRFDSLACALLLAACLRLSQAERGTDRTAVWQAALLLGAAVAMKSFPVLALPAFLARVRHGRLQFLAIAAVPALAVSAPYYRSLAPLWHDTVVYNMERRPGYLSWVGLVDPALPRSTLRVVEIAAVLLVVGLIVTVRRATDIWTYAAIALVAVLLCEKLVLEQYLIWPLPFLAVIAARRAGADRGVALLTALCFTGAGLLSNASFHPFGRSPLVIIVLLGCVSAGFLVHATRWGANVGRSTRTRRRKFARLAGGSA